MNVSLEDNKTVSLPTKCRTFRTPETEARYRLVREQRANSNEIPDMRIFPVVRSYTHWTIVENDFPYDAIASVHHLLVPTRDTFFQNDIDMTPEERAELHEIKEEINEKAEYTMLIWSPYYQ